MQSTFTVPKKLTKQVEELSKENNLYFSHFSLDDWKNVNFTIEGKVEDYNIFSRQLQKLLEVEENEN